MRLIDADALIENWQEDAEYMETEIFKLATYAAINDVKHAPTVVPERKKGKWILSDEQRREDTDNDNYRYVCSNCLHSDIHAKTQEVPYCWWCGADMRGE